MKVHARCNRRQCQARRNLSKRPEYYKRWPKCHIPGCSGSMYVDEYRMRKGPKDNAPVCRDRLCPFVYTNVDRSPVHRVSTKGCSGYEDYAIGLALRGPVKHTPCKLNHDSEPPF